jgi:hypothetical protein
MKTTQRLLAPLRAPPPCDAVRRKKASETWIGQLGKEAERRPDTPETLLRAAIGVSSHT